MHYRTKKNNRKGNILRRRPSICFMKKKPNTHRKLIGTNTKTLRFFEILYLINKSYILTYYVYMHTQTVQSSLCDKTSLKSPKK